MLDDLQDDSSEKRESKAAISPAAAAQPASEECPPELKESLASMLCERLSPVLTHHPNLLLDTSSSLLR